MGEKMDITSIRHKFMRYFRTKRRRDFAENFRIDDQTRILDLGGSEFNCHLIEQEPHVTIININTSIYERGRFKSIEGDWARLELPDQWFDVAYSNSVIEDVGDYEDQERFSVEFCRLAPRYDVQTPNKWFPVEPHYISVCIRWLPKEIQKKVVKYFSVWGWIAKPSKEQVDKTVDEIRVLDKSEMKKLFPDAKILTERFFGFPKSYIAIRR